MCMEDIRIGRATDGEYRTRAIAATATQILMRNKWRTRAVIFGPRSGSVSIAPNSSLIVGEGIVMTAGDEPKILRVEEYGNLLCLDWWAISTVGTTSVDLWDGALTRE